MFHHYDIILHFLKYWRPCVGSRTKRRTVSWMLVTMHSNISGYLWLIYYALTYTMCWNSYAPQDGQVNWNYFQLSFLGSLRIGMYSTTNNHMNYISHNVISNFIKKLKERCYLFISHWIVVSLVVSITGAIGNAKFYVPCTKMSPYEVSDFILHLKSLNPKLKVTISTLGSSLTSRYASRLSNEDLPGEKEFEPFKW